MYYPLYSPTSSYDNKYNIKYSEIKKIRKSLELHSFWIKKSWKNYLARMKPFTPHLVLVKAIQISRRFRCHRSTELTPSFGQLGSSAASFTWPKKKGTASRNIFHIYDLPFFQRVFGKQSGEIRIASMKDCVSVWIQQLRKSAHLANLYV